MKADLYAKISKYVLYGLFALSVLVFVLFFVAGSPLTLEQVSEATNETTILEYPRFTELSLYLCYAMFIVTLLLVVVFECMAVVKNMKYSTEGLAKKIVRIAVVLVVVVVIYFVSPTNVDFLLYLQYVLLGAAALCMLGSSFMSKMRS